MKINPLFFKNQRFSSHVHVCAITYSPIFCFSIREEAFESLHLHKTFCPFLGLLLINPRPVLQLGFVSWFSFLPFISQHSISWFAKFFHLAGVEARGFMFGPSIALAIGAKFVPLRKPKKLPGTMLERGFKRKNGDSAAAAA